MKLIGNITAVGNHETRKTGKPLSTLRKERLASDQFDSWYTNTTTTTQSKYVVWACILRIPGMKAERFHRQSPVKMQLPTETRPRQGTTLDGRTHTELLHRH